MAAQRSPPIDFKDDPHNLKPEQLIDLAVSIFEHAGCVRYARIDADKMRRLFREIKDQHRHNPYHNFFHACHVLLNVYRFLHCIIGQFPPVDVFGILIAAFVHDLDHLGTTNTVLIEKKHELARLYDNKSPLENNSITTALNLFRREEMDIFSELSKEDRGIVEMYIRDLILATDIGNQATKENLWRDWDRDCGKNFKMTNLTHRVSLTRALLLCADIGIVCEPPQVYIPWCQRLYQETVNIDNTTSRSKYYEGQGRFLDYYAAPLFERVKASGIVSSFDKYFECFRANQRLMRSHIANSIDSELALSTENNNSEKEGSDKSEKGRSD